MAEELEHHPSYDQYYKMTENSAQSPLLIAATALVPKKEKAIDLGCGAGADTRFLAEHFVQVDAVDSSQLAIERIKRLGIANVVPLQQHVHETDFSDIDLVNAQHLFLYLQMGWHAALFDIAKGLRPGGLFVANFAGRNDFRRTYSGIITYTPDMLKNNLHGLEPVVFSDLEYDQLIRGGSVHIHDIRLVARKPF